jgi:hypothetical protein
MKEISYKLWLEFQRCQSKAGSAAGLYIHKYKWNMVKRNSAKKRQKKEKRKREEPAISYRHGAIVAL